ncbi:MAG: hypothetical protein M1829_001994 [Trizodia sp. TS-e1964]|nr:MAG: hypothetical protein M1829_001994 [Trizodia sp. TS-e1964]
MRSASKPLALDDSRPLKRTTPHKDEDGDMEMPNAQPASPHLSDTEMDDAPSTLSPTSLLILPAAACELLPFEESLLLTLSCRMAGAKKRKAEKLSQNAYLVKRRAREAKMGNAEKENVDGKSAEATMRRLEFGSFNPAYEVKEEDFKNNNGDLTFEDLEEEQDEKALVKAERAEGHKEPAQMTPVEMAEAIKNKRQYARLQGYLRVFSHWQNHWCKDYGSPSSRLKLFLPLRLCVA